MGPFNIQQLSIIIPPHNFPPLQILLQAPQNILLTIARTIIQKQHIISSIVEFAPTKIIAAVLSEEKRLICEDQIDGARKNTCQSGCIA